MRKSGDATLIAVIYERYEIWSDGIIYDTKKAEDIPQHIFRVRDELLEHNWEEYEVE
jgi:hypothetical protein